MPRFIVKRSYFCNFHEALLNITVKPDMLNISLFPQIFLSLCLRKKDKFYIYILRITKSYSSYLKIIEEARSHGSFILIIKLQETYPGCFVDLFICRFINDMFQFNQQIFRLFPVFFTLFFVSRVFLYFPLSKPASCSRYTHFHSRKLEFLSKLG